MLGRFIVPAAAFGVLLLLLPAAAAHETYESDDGEYLITVGSQGEPVHTFQVTNLDLIIREHLGDGERGDEVNGVHETLNATLVGPGGEELSHPLSLQFGAEGRYEFEEAYVLTQPGVYVLRLEGMIGDTVVDGTYDLPHAIMDQSEIMFPDQGLPNPRDVAALQERVEELESEVAQLRSQNGGGGGDGGDDAEAPGPGALALVGLLAICVVMLRRRK